MSDSNEAKLASEELNRELTEKLDEVQDKINHVLDSLETIQEEGSPQDFEAFQASDQRLTDLLNKVGALSTKMIRIKHTRLKYKPYADAIKSRKSELTQDINDVSKAVNDEIINQSNQLSAFNRNNSPAAVMLRQIEEEQKRADEEAEQRNREREAIQEAEKNKRIEAKNIQEEGNRKREEIVALRKKFPSEISSTKATDATLLNEELEIICQKIALIRDDPLLVEVRNELVNNKYAETQRASLAKAKDTLEKQIQDIHDYCMALKNDNKEVTKIDNLTKQYFSSLHENPSNDIMDYIMKKTEAQIQMKLLKEKMKKVKELRILRQIELEHTLKGQYEILTEYGKSVDRQISKFLKDIGDRIDKISTEDKIMSQKQRISQWENEINQDLGRIKESENLDPSTIIENYRKLNEKVSEILKILDGLISDESQNKFKRFCETLQKEFSGSSSQNSLSIYDIQMKLNEVDREMKKVKSILEKNDTLKKLKNGKKNKDIVQKLGYLENENTKELMKQQRDELEKIYKKLTEDIEEPLKTDYEKRYTYTKWFFMRQIQSFKDTYEDIKLDLDQLQGQTNQRRASHLTPALAKILYLSEKEIGPIVEEIKKTYLNLEALQEELNKGKEEEQRVRKILMKAGLEEYRANNIIVEMKKGNIFILIRDTLSQLKKGLGDLPGLIVKDIHDDNLTHQTQLKLLMERIQEIKSSMPDDRKELTKFLTTEFGRVIACVKEESNVEEIKKVQETLMESIESQEHKVEEIKEQLKISFSNVEDSLQKAHSKLNGFQKAIINFEGSLVQQKIHNDITEKTLKDIGENLETIQDNTIQFMKQGEITKEEVKYHIDKSLSDINKNLREMSMDQENFINNIKKEMNQKCDEIGKENSSSREEFLKILEDLSTTVGSVETKLGTLVDEVSEIKTNQMNLFKAIQEMKENKGLRGELESIKEILTKVTDDSQSIKEGQEELRKFFEQQQQNILETLSTSSASLHSPPSSSSSTTLDEIKAILLKSTNDDGASDNTDDDNNDEKILHQMKYMQNQLESLLELGKNEHNLMNRLLEQGEKNKEQHEQMKNFVFQMMSGEYKLPTFISIIDKDELRKKDFYSKLCHWGHKMTTVDEMFSTKYKLFFHCSRCMNPAKCGEKGHGYNLLNKKALKSLLPIFKVTSLLLRVGVAFAGLPIKFPFGDIKSEELDALSEKLLDDDQLEDIEEELKDTIKGLTDSIDQQKILSPDLIGKMKPMTARCHNTIEHLMVKLDPYHEMLGLELIKGGLGSDTAIEWICSTCKEGFEAEGNMYGKVLSPPSENSVAMGA